MVLTCCVQPGGFARRRFLSFTLLASQPCPLVPTVIRLMALPHPSACLPFCANWTMIATTISLHYACCRRCKTRLHQLTLGLWPRGRGCRFFWWSELCPCMSVARTDCDTVQQSHPTASACDRFQSPNTRPAAVDGLRSFRMALLCCILPATQNQFV